MGLQGAGERKMIKVYVKFIPDGVKEGERQDAPPCISKISGNTSVRNQESSRTYQRLSVDEI